MTNQSMTPVQKNVQTIQSLMEKYKGEIGKALPKHMTPDRMLRIAFTCLRINPKLQECDPLSFMGAIIQASSLGLEPGAQGHAYLIPFRNNKKGITECQFIPGYRGLIDLARRSGQIESIAAHVVYENDEFEYEYGFNERLVHKPAMSDRGAFKCVYAFAKLKDGGKQFEVMSVEQITKIQKSTRYPNPVWDSHFDEMARKTAIRRLYKYLPTSIEMVEAMNYEELNDEGLSQSNRTVIDASFTPDMESNPTTIAEINKQESDEHERMEKENAIKMLTEKIKSELSKGVPESVIIQRLGFDLQGIVLKDSKTLYAALEVLIDS